MIQTLSIINSTSNPIAATVIIFLLVSLVFFVPIFLADNFKCQVSKAIQDNDNSTDREAKIDRLFFQYRIRQLVTMAVVLVAVLLIF